MPAAALWRGLRGGAVAGGFLIPGLCTPNVWPEVYKRRQFRIPYRAERCFGAGDRSGSISEVAPDEGTAGSRRSRGRSGNSYHPFDKRRFRAEPFKSGRFAYYRLRGCLRRPPFGAQLLFERERFETVATGQIACAALPSSLSLSVEAPKAVGAVRCCSHSW